MDDSSGIRKNIDSVESETEKEIYFVREEYMCCVFEEVEKVSIFPASSSNNVLHLRSLILCFLSTKFGFCD